ncbi:MAG: hypothetical protein IPM75_15040 [Candidatus Competibacteraceae bacterium]|nr:hypothetical protein [Candidatus Competibacteraceae bacterium]
MTFKRLASRVVGFLLLAGIGTWGSPALAAPTLWLYYALGSADPADPIPIMTLIEGGTLTAATGETLWRPYQLDALPASALRRGQALQSTAPLGLISGAEHSIALVPDAWEGALFVSPHHRGRQFYSLMSPHADTAAEIAIADRHYVVRLPEGVAGDFDAGLEEGATAVLRAGEPIRVARWSVDGGRRAGPEPVPPAGTERWGWFDAPALIAAAENGTSLTLYTSRGERDERRLNAGNSCCWSLTPPIRPRGPTPYFWRRTNRSARCGRAIPPWILRARGWGPPNWGPISACPRAA